MKPETKEKIIQVAITAGVSIVTIGILVLAIVPQYDKYPSAYTRSICRCKRTGLAIRINPDSDLHNRDGVNPHSCRTTIPKRIRRYGTKKEIIFSSTCHGNSLGVTCCA